MFVENILKADFMELSIIIPTYNEAGTIQRVVARAAAALKDILYEFIVVDDSSSDGTAGIVRSLSAKYPIKMIQRTGKSGLASAVMEGCALAQGDFICVLDADLSHPPEQIPLLFESCEKTKSDVVIASRFLKESVLEEFSGVRRLLSRLAIVLTKPLTSIHDPLSGFFLMKKDVVSGIHVIPRGYKILLEILVRGKCRHVSELPFVFGNRKAGKSKLTMRVHWDFLIQVWSLYWYKIKSWRTDKGCCREGINSYGT